MNVTMKNRVAVVRNSKMLEYDSSTMYRQMAFASKAADICQAALSSLLLGIQLNQDEHHFAKALQERSNRAAAELIEINRLALHLAASSAPEEAHALTNACEASRQVLSWWDRFLKEHSQKHIDDLKEVTADVQRVHQEIKGVRDLKVDDVKALEERYNKEKKNKNKSKEASHQHQLMSTQAIDPKDVTPVVDPKALIDSAKIEMRVREAANILSKLK